MGGATLKIFGNVLNILEGNVNPSLLRAIEQSHLRFALGGATFSDAHGIGETLLIEGIPHISWVQNEKLLDGTQPKASSPFLMGIDVRQPIGSLLAAPAQLSLEIFYEQLAQKYPKGFALVGSFRMAKFCGIYLKHPPIYHENINEHSEIYWSPVETYQKALICLFGVVIPPAAKQTFPAEVLQRAFYKNPKELKTQAFDSHTHAALVDKLVQAKEPEPFLQELGQLKIGSVRHVLTESVIQEGAFVLFPLNKVIGE